MLSRFRSLKNKFNFLLVAFIILLTIFSTFKIFQDDDIFWHLATGRYILENKSIPSTDIFTYMDTDIKWIPCEWGWDIITYSIYNFGGYVALSIFRTLLLIMTFVFLILSLRNLNVNQFLIYVSLLLVSIAILPRMSIRPHLFSYLGYAFLIYVFTSVNLDEKKFKLLYIVPIVFLFWANIHMSVMLGFAIVLLFTVFYLIKKKTYNLKQVKFTLWILVVTFLMMMINPHNIYTYIYVYENLSADMLQNINEWRSPFSSDRSVYNIIYFLFLILSVYSMFYLIKKKDYFPLLVIVLTSVNSLKAVRFIPDFLLLSIVFITASLGPLWEKVVLRKHTYSINRILNITLLIIFLGLSYFSYTNEFYSKFIKSNFRETGFGINERFFPVKMFNFMKETNLEQIGSKPFNSFNIGGYFVWEFPGLKNFIDSRITSEKRYNLYRELNGVNVGFEAKLKQLGIDYVLYNIPTMTLNASVLDKTIIAYLSTNPDWKLLYWDDISFLFVKNEMKFTNLIKQYEYKYLNPYKYIFQSKNFFESYNNDKNGFVQEVMRKQSEDPQSKILKDIIRRLNIGIKVN